MLFRLVNCQQQGRYRPGRCDCSVLNVRRLVSCSVVGNTQGTDYVRDCYPVAGQSVTQVAGLPSFCWLLIRERCNAGCTTTQSPDAQKPQILQKSTSVLPFVTSPRLPTHDGVCNFSSEPGVSTQAAYLSVQYRSDIEQGPNGSEDTSVDCQGRAGRA